MKYYSETLKKVYDTPEELEKAELAVSDKKKAREARAKEVEEAITAAHEANEHARDLLTKFCKDYGSFHTSIKDPVSFDPFSWFTDLFF